MVQVIKRKKKREGAKLIHTSDTFAAARLAATLTAMIVAIVVVQLMYCHRARLRVFTSSTEI